MNPLPTVLALVFTVLMTGCVPGLCANTITQRASSPGGSYDAVVFTRDCGATTDYSTQVSLIRRGDHLRDQGGNVFISPHATGAQVEWVSPDTLLVHYGSTNPVLKVPHVAGIRIVYAGMP